LQLKLFITKLARS